MKIWCDGSKTHLALVFEDGTELIEALAVPTTTNQAEYRAILWALDYCTYIFRPIEILSDSQLAVNQINSIYTIHNPALSDLAREVKQVVDKLEEEEIYVKFRWIPREENKAGWALEKKLRR